MGSLQRKSLVFAPARSRRRRYSVFQRILSPAQAPALQSPLLLPAQPPRHLNFPVLLQTHLLLPRVIRPWILKMLLLSLQHIPLYPQVQIRNMPRTILWRRHSLQNLQSRQRSRCSSRTDGRTYGYLAPNNRSFRPGSPHTIRESIALLFGPSKHWRHHQSQSTLRPPCCSRGPDQSHNKREMCR
ncbi:hypothetical protein BDZ85DRAFT_49734 [Elsinoe ampelina]|uniref:Uncharacterized protein n=1 Tax=Elsinoe ampelina TaxID=302913 RepID=A0A6A6GM16_9PEZI|nr:hypothetical protein BDZ85DRAFT_49734 [Elsinoe ampelina]